MSKTTRDAMTSAWSMDRDVSAGGTIGAADPVDEALRVMLERGAHSLAVADGGVIIGTVTAGELAVSIEDASTWSALCG